VLRVNKFLSIPLIRSVTVSKLIIIIGRAEFKVYVSERLLLTIARAVIEETCTR